MSRPASRTRNAPVAGLRKTRPAPEVEVEEIDVSLGSIKERVIIDPADDPFQREIGYVRKMDGVSDSLKRKGARMEKAHKGVDGAESKKIEETAFYGTGYALFDVVQPPYNMEYLAKLNLVSASHYAAIKAKVANIVALGFDFVETHKTKQVLERADSEEKTAKLRRKLSAAKGELHQWLDSCNQDDEFVETMIKVWTDYEATGNGYFEIGRTISGEIGYIGHIPAVGMRIRRKRDGFVEVLGDKAKFFRNFGDRDTPNPVGNDPRPNEVIHIKKYSPTGNYYGVPDIIPAMNAVTGDEFSAKFNLDYFENKAVPRYVVVLKGGSLSRTSKQNILEFFQTNLKGQNHRTLFVPLPADGSGVNATKSSFEMNPVEAGTQDSSFVNYRKGNLYEILMAHRTPITKAFGPTDGINLAIARDADKTFKEQVTRPEQSILEKKLNKVIAEKTDVFKLKLNELALSDEDTLSKMDERYLRWSVMTPNEIRARWGWTGLKGGDKAVGMMEQMDAKNEVAQQVAEQRATATASRARDSTRSAASSDSSGEARQPKGEGRAAA